MPLTAPTGPVEWVALSFPGAEPDSGVAAPPAELVRTGAVRAQQQAQVDAQVAEALRVQAPPPAPAPAARPSVDELHAQLMKLGELRQAGLLTDDEFAQQKARLLA